ncbi:MAG TPA: hypothetical protein VK576_08535, partial [Thermoleophilia bacterium]|nr:hypothetical protein [Thermoleophilia bacterium]
EEWARYLREFDAEVHHACLEDGLWDQPERTWMSLLQVLGIATMVVAVLATLGLGRGWPLVGVVVGWVVVLLAGRQLYRPRPHALQLYRRYAALREFMRASGGMDDKPAEAVAVWDEYLVLAVGLGLARHAVLDLGVESAPDVTADLPDEILVSRSP